MFLQQAARKSGSFEAKYKKNAGWLKTFAQVHGST